MAQCGPVESGSVELWLGVVIISIKIQLKLYAKTNNGVNCGACCRSAHKSQLNYAFGDVYQSVWSALPILTFFPSFFSPLSIVVLIGRGKVIDISIIP